MNMSKSFNKRQNTLLPEYKNQFKSNRFTDKRIGENDSKLSLEEKMFKRFTVERNKNKDKINKFNLNNNDEDIELTHFGQNLAQIEKFDKNDMADSDNDENDLENGNINANMVSENFFGGFDTNEDENSKRKNRKEWIEEMIAKSKQLKYHKQCEKEKTLDMTAKLDNDWKEMHNLLSGFLKKNNQTKNDIPSKKDQDYDVLVQTLRFDLKAQPSNKMKTLEEIEKDKIKSLKTNEMELIKRMNLNEEESVPEIADFKKLKTIETIYKSPDDMDFTEFECEPLKQKKLNFKEIQEDNKNENDFEMDQIFKKRENNETFSIEDEEWFKNFNCVCDALSNKKINNDEFVKKVRKIIMDLNPGLNENNKQRLSFISQNLFEFYKFNCLNRDYLDYELLNLLSELIFHLGINYLKENIGDMFYNIIKDLKDNVTSIDKLNMPNLDTIFTFKLVSLIFPTSDYKHKIVTPCFMLMNHYLYYSNLITIIDCLKGLFLTNLCYEFIVRSKRYVTECIDYLNSCLYLAVDKKIIKKSLIEFHSSVILKSFKLANFDLIPKNKINCVGKINFSIINIGEEDIKMHDLDMIKINIISLCLNMIDKFSKLYESNMCFKEIFELTSNLIDMLPLNLYPPDLQLNIKKINSFIFENNKKTRTSLQILDKKPLRLQLLEPKIESKTKFDPRHHNTVISVKQLQTKNYKKEYKAAVKEIRKDNKFIAGVQFNEIMERDVKRKKKVKEIMNSLSNQEGEYRKTKKIKK